MNKSRCIECEVCTLPFDKQSRAPRIFPRCGHSLCTACLHSLIDKAAGDCISCVFCRREHPIAEDICADLSPFPRNMSVLALMDVANPASGQHTCLEHDQPASFICFDARCREKDLACHLCLLKTHRACDPTLILLASQVGEKVVYADCNSRIDAAVLAVSATVELRLNELRTLVHQQLEPLLRQLRALKINIDFGDLDSVRENAGRLHSAFDPRSRLVMVSNAHEAAMDAALALFTEEYNKLLGEPLAASVAKLFAGFKRSVATREGDVELYSESVIIEDKPIARLQDSFSAEEEPRYGEPLDVAGEGGEGERSPAPRLGSRLVVGALRRSDRNDRRTLIFSDSAQERKARGNRNQCALF